LPKAPWTPAQLDQVLRALDDLQEATTPCPVRALRSVPDTLGPDLLGFEHVAADPPQDLEPWLADHLDELRASARRGIDALDGNTLCHADVRADNMLITDHGAVSFVDWAHASRRSRVSDALRLLSSVEDPDGALRVNARIDVVLETHGLPRQVGTDVLSGILGFFVDAARWPHDPRLPFRGPPPRLRGDGLLPLLRERGGRAAGSGPTGGIGSAAQAAPWTTAPPSKVSPKTVSIRPPGAMIGHPSAVAPAPQCPVISGLVISPMRVM